MKKIIVVIIIGLLVNAAVFAQHDGLGIGVVGGGAGSFREGYGNLGLSLKIPGIPIFWGIYGNFLDNYPGIGITGDYYFIDSNFVSSRLTGDDGSYYNLRLDWYFGAGFFFNLYSGKSDNYVNLGARLPIGIAWFIIRPLELFVELAPDIGFTNIGDNPLHLGWSARIGLRYWLGN